MPAARQPASARPNRDRAPSLPGPAGLGVQALAAISPTHDASGNLTCDGLYKFTWDAWNRLVKVTRAYRDGNGDLQSGSQIAALAYDPLGRRIIVRLHPSATDSTGSGGSWPEVR
ncbi:MAG: hypothetical protein BIFFINMI_01521 [Phycisphaerae bacterium]|nr:hypothetical protein [Phycisphaerae bacterium]